MTMDATSDEQLAAAGQSGDRRAFERLIERYYSRVFYIARGILRDEERASDAAQETFMRMVEKIGQYRTDRRFFPWLYRITANVSINSIRRAGRRPAVFDPRDIARMTACEPDDGVGHGEDAARIALVVDSLPDDYRAVVTLKLLEDLSTDDIARMLDISPNLVRVRLHRGLALIRRRLKTKEDGADIIPFGNDNGKRAQGAEG